MQNRPTAAELVGAVATFIEQDVMPALEGGLNFRCRVAANALRIVERELDLAPDLDTAERKRLMDLLGADGPLADLNLDISERIRSGAISIDDPDLLDHLKRTTLGKASIDNPKYSGYRDATKPEAGT
jgi:hypothetical protein